MRSVVLAHFSPPPMAAVRDFNPEYFTLLAAEREPAARRHQWFAKPIETAIAVLTTINDKRRMVSFDDIEVRRPELARSYLTLLAAQPGRPIALFAPRRVGKTFFLDSDLGPGAVKAGLIPVYADL